MDSEHSLTLNTGAQMPVLGLGTWKAKPGDVGKAVAHALTEARYTHIDCAAVYQNEAEIGETLKSVFVSGKVKREDVFITSKLWNSAHRRDAVHAACEETLRDLKLEYLDLYLMHWGIATPFPPDAATAAKNNWDKDENGYQLLEKVPVRETWEAMQDLMKAGLVKAIGVANFNVPQIIDLMSYASTVPAVVQVELHPYLQQSRLVEFCQRHGITVTAYSPLGSPGNYGDKHPRLAEDPVIVSIATAYAKSSAQVLLRWGIQRGTIVIPKSVHPERIKENIDVFDFELNAADLQAIGGLERNLRFVDPYEWGKIPYFS